MCIFIKWLRNEQQSSKIYISVSSKRRAKGQAEPNVYISRSSALSLIPRLSYVSRISASASQNVCYDFRGFRLEFSAIFGSPKILKEKKIQEKMGKEKMGKEEKNWSMSFFTER